MRILVLNHEYPPVGGGGGRVARDLNYGFCQHGHEVKILTPMLKDLAKIEDSSHYEIIRIPSLRKYAFRATLKDMGAFIISSYLAGAKLIKTWQPDVIQAHFAVPAGVSARMLSRRFNIPYFVTAHLGDIPGGAPEKTRTWFRFFYPFTKKIWQDAEHIVTVSHYTKELAKQSYPTVEPQVIYNGVDTSTIKPVSYDIHDPIQIVFAGRFMKQKNPLLIVEALNQLKTHAWKCVMMGDGPLKPLVEKQIANYGLTNRFQLTGWVDPEQVLETYEKSDILFMPSRSEGLPVAGVQAIAMGLAPVLANVGGCPDLVVDNQSGFLVESEDLSGFVEALEKLFGDPALLLKFKHQSRKHAEIFNLDGIITQYESLMQSIVDK